MGIRISVVYMIFALADYGYQKWKFKEDMKMTKQEVKEESAEEKQEPTESGTLTADYSASFSNQNTVLAQKLKYIE